MGASRWEQTNADTVKQTSEPYFIRGSWSHLALQLTLIIESISAFSTKEDKTVDIDTQMWWGCVDLVVYA